MKHDDAEFYFLNFSDDLPNENGGRHIALFLEWAILRGLASESMSVHAEPLRSGAMDPVDLLFRECDGKLMDEDLSDEGNAFVTACYDAHHYADFAAAMNVANVEEIDAIFDAELTRQRHDRVLWQLDRRYSDWRRTLGLPDKDAFGQRMFAILGPIFEAAGFAHAPGRTAGSHEVFADFERRGTWGMQRVQIGAADSPGWFYGVHVACNVHIPRLHEVIYREKTADLGVVTSDQFAATIPFARLAEGWAGPMQIYEANSHGFWVFRDEDIEPLAHWLAARLESFVLPVLRGLDCVDAVALAYGTTPLSVSPIHIAGDPYAALLSAEMARHPRLGAMLDETEQALRALDRDPKRLEEGGLALIARIRSRSRALIA